MAPGGQEFPDFEDFTDEALTEWFAENVVGKSAFSILRHKGEMDALLDSMKFMGRSHPRPDWAFEFGRLGRESRLDILKWWAGQHSRWQVHRH